MNRFLTAHTHD